jgi:hypothetical protein
VLLRYLAGREHEPDGAGGFETGDEVGQIGRSLKAGFFGQFLRDAGIAIPGYDINTALAQPPGHVGPHAPQTDQSQFHGQCLPELSLQEC